ncbi:MAG: hypothetical protein HZA08_11060 [Nitrospirae bacterium]|nr:hypothetical protein [Nitrospirota bacterium]
MRTTIQARNLIAIVFVISLVLVSTVSYAKDKEYKGPKKRIAVMDFEDKSSNQHAGWHDVGRGMSDSLVTALVKTNRFIVIEREQINKIMNEQSFGLSGAVNPDTAAKVGKLIGVGMIVTGGITEFGVKESKLGVGSLGRVLPFGGGAGMKTNTARVALDIRFVDTSTGQIMVAEKAEGEESSHGVDIDLSIAPSVEFGKEGFDETVIGKASRKAIEQAIEKISSAMENVPWQGSVVKVSGSQIFINTGSDDGRKAGDTFIVYRAGEELVDPDTGESLGSQTEKIGKIQITEVKDKRLSIAKPVDGSGFMRADIIKDK